MYKPVKKFVFDNETDGFTIKATHHDTQTGNIAGDAKWAYGTD